MFVFNTLFVFYLLSSLVFGLIDLRTNKILPSVINDDVCSSVIIEYSCVKNLLTVLVDRINENMQEIESLKLRISRHEKILKEKILKNEKHTQNSEYNHLIANDNDQEIKVMNSEIKKLVLLEQLKSQSMTNVDAERYKEIESFLQNHTIGSFDPFNKLRVDQMKNISKNYTKVK